MLLRLAKLALFLRMLLPYGFISIFIAKKIEREQKKTENVPATLFRVLIICCRLTIRAIGDFLSWLFLLPSSSFIICFAYLFCQIWQFIKSSCRRHFNYNLLIHIVWTHCHCRISIWLSLLARNQFDFCFPSHVPRVCELAVSGASGGIWRWPKTKKKKAWIVRCLWRLARTHSGREAVAPSSLWLRRHCQCHWRCCWHWLCWYLQQMAKWQDKYATRLPVVCVCV